MAQIDQRLIDVFKQYDEDARTGTWDCHGTRVAYHPVIERIAAKAGIRFRPPVIIEANAEKRIAVVMVEAEMGERTEWSFGEASPHNNKNSYPFAMAEKRAKDRVALKLAGLHGLIYSEEEADDFKPDRDDDREFPQGNFAAGQNAAPSKSSAQLKREVDLSKEFEPELAECLSLPMLEKFRIDWKKIADRDGWNTSFRHMAQELMARQKDHIISQMSPEHLAVLPLKDTLQASLRTSVQRPPDDDFPGDR